MKPYAMIIDQHRKVVLDIILFHVFERSGWVDGLRVKYEGIIALPNTPNASRRVGWVDCRTLKAERHSIEWLKEKGYK